MSFTVANIVGPSGKTADVTDQGQLLVDTRNAGLIACQNGDAFSLVIEADPNGTDQDFIYLENLDARDLVITKIRMSTGTLDIDVDIKLDVTGTPGSGTAVVGANLRAGGASANIHCEYRDEDLALTGGTVVDTLYIDKDFVGEQEFDYPSGIILPKSRAMVFNCVAVDPTADIKTVIFFHFADTV